MKRIAITGGIGSGKTAVTDYLRALGYTVIDADEMSRAMTAPGGKAIPYIREHFGDDFILPDGSLDRRKMRELVYHDPEARRLLEAGTTRVIIEDVKTILAACEESGEQIAFIAVPLLFETRTEGDYDESWAVLADLEVRMERIRRRDHLTDDMIRRILDQQVGDDVRRARATEVIENNGSLEALQRNVSELISKKLK